MKNQLPITSITIGLDVRDMEYGSGSGRFLHMKADAPEGTEGLTYEQAMEQSLQMHLEAWKSVIMARYASGKGTAEEAAVRIEKFRKKLDRVIKFVKDSEQDDISE